MKLTNNGTTIRVATLFVALLACCIGLCGQATTTSSVIGLVTDSTSAAPPGADVTLTDLGTKIAQKVSTNENGRYVFRVQSFTGTSGASDATSRFRPNLKWRS
jgi:hypothetical protein